jgi:hypothetical protein
MHTPKRDPESYDPRESYAAKQLSRYDMQIAGIVVFVVTMTMFFVVALVMMLFRNEPAAQARFYAPKAAITAVGASSTASSHGDNARTSGQSKR